MSATDPGALRLQYDSDQHLRLRQLTHQQYTVPAVDFPRWVLERAAWRGDERVLDVGAGAPAYYQTLKALVPQASYTAFDLSMGMLEKHPAIKRVGGDAQALPFEDASFDVVLANHMLFHVPEIARAIIEIHRILKPDGVLIAATNSIGSMPEIQALFRRAIMLLGTPGRTAYTQPPPPSHTSFSLENGTVQLARSFYAVVRHDLPGALIFDRPEPILAFIDSWRSLREPNLPAEIQWDDLMQLMRDQIVRVINHFGELSVSKLSGAFVATDRGDFIREYLKRSEPPTG